MIFDVIIAKRLQLTEGSDDSLHLLAIEYFFFFFEACMLLRASLVAQTVKNLPEMHETWVHSLRRGRSPGEVNGNILQYSCLENSMDRGAWWATVHGVAKSRTQLRDFNLLRLLHCFLDTMLLHT